MFSRKKIKEQFMISIPEPCSEDWNKMTVVDREHKHCSSCEKVVVDFTSMSDDEIVLFFRHNKQKTCGRFSQVQLQKTFTSLPEQTRVSNWWKAAILLPLTLLTKTSAAQQNDSAIVADTITTNPDTLKESVKEITDSSIVQSDSLTSIQDTAVVLHNDTLNAPAEIVVSAGTAIPITLSPPSMGSVSADPAVYGGFQQVIVMGDITMPPPGAVGFVNTCYVQLPPEPVKLDFLPLWSHYSKPDPNKDDIVIETDTRKVTDPVKPTPDPIPPTIPESPWYEAILPSSLRPRRNG